MSSAIHTDDEVIAALKRCGSIRSTAVDLGVSRSGLQQRIKTLAKRGYSPEHDMTRTVPDGYHVKGVSTLYREDGTIAQQWVKSSADAQRAQETHDAMLAALLAKLPKLPKPKRVSGAKYLKDLTTVYPIGDAHIGMRAWAAECGKDWDLSIAQRVICGVMDLLVSKVLATETATIIDLGDWTHQDTNAAVTPRSGHPLDGDGRFAKIVHVAISVMRRCIESARMKHKRVHVICIPGNHNEVGAFWLSAALANIYENDPNVTVETQPSLFAYFEFGKNLVGVHHGHTCKMPQLPGVMAADRAEAWGRTTHRYWYTGHIHHQQIQEYPGCTVESFNTLASNDAYATNGGWRSRENMKAIYLHKEWGEIQRETAHPAMLESA